MKQSMELRKKQVRRAKQTKEEQASKNVNNVVSGRFGKFLQRQQTIEIQGDENSELLRKLKAWKEYKRKYQRKMAEELTVDMEKDQV